MASAEVLRKKETAVSADQLPAVRALVQALFPGIPPAAAKELRVWPDRAGDGSTQIRCAVIYNATVTIELLKDIILTKEACDLLDITP